MKSPQQLNYDSLLTRMSALCSKSEHCESEIRSKLRQTELEPALQDKIIDTLYDEGFLDNDRYCRAYALDQFRFTGWGRLKIRQALRFKKLPDEAIAKALEEIPQEEYEEKLRTILQTKNHMLKEDDDYKRRGKLVQFAASRGFLYDEIDAILDGVIFS